MQTEGEVAGARRRRAARHPVLAVHDGHHVDRGRRGSEPARPQLVPALHVEGPRPVDGPGRPGGEGGVRHAAGHRRRPGGGRAAARQAQRHLHPARPERPDRPRRPAPAGVVVQLPHHRAAGLRVAGPMVGHGRRADRHDVRPDRRPSRTWPGSGTSGRARSSSKASRPSTTPAASPTSVSTASSCRTTAGDSSTGRRSRSTCCPTWSARSARTYEILLDTGIMSGADIVAAVALGARFTLVGRAYLYGLMAGGRGRRRPGRSTSSPAR